MIDRRKLNLATAMHELRRALDLIQRQQASGGDAEEPMIHSWLNLAVLSLWPLLSEGDREYISLFDGQQEDHDYLAHAWGCAEELGLLD